MLRHACTALVAMLTVLLAPYFVHAGRCEAGFPVDWCPAVRAGAGPGCVCVRGG